METYKLTVNGQQKEVSTDPGTPVALGVARGIEDDWHKVRLRHRCVRRLHSPSWGRAYAILCCPCFSRGKPADCHHRSHFK